MRRRWTYKHPLTSNWHQHFSTLRFKPGLKTVLVHQLQSYSIIVKIYQDCKFKALSVSHQLHFNICRVPNTRVNDKQSAKTLDNFHSRAESRAKWSLIREIWRRSEQRQQARIRSLHLPQWWYLQGNVQSRLKTWKRHHEIFIDWNHIPWRVERGQNVRTWNAVFSTWGDYWMQFLSRQYPGWQNKDTGKTECLF